jgi:hypothetical protein
MNIQIYSTALYMGEVNSERNELGSILNDSGQRVGRVEIDWGDENNVDHLAYVYRGEDCVANISLDRYMADVGVILRRESRIGEIKRDPDGNMSVFRGNKLLGTLKASDSGISSRHLILLGGGGAIVLLGI